MVNNQNDYKKNVFYKTQSKITALSQKIMPERNVFRAWYLISEIIVLHGISSVLHPLSTSSFLLVMMDVRSLKYDILVQDTSD